MRIEFTVPGKPVGKGRPKFAGRGKFVHAYTPEKTRAFEEKVLRCWETQSAYRIPEGVPIIAYIDSWFPIPSSTSKKQKALLEGTFHIKRPDSDNIAKSVLDALNGHAFADDSAVQIGRSYKYQTTAAPRVEVVLEWEEAE